jgi:curved DNA-binding protein CbpA
MRDEPLPSRVESAYAVLGVTPHANAAEILAAYRSLARRHHPDLAGEAETARMSRINAAFDTLRDSRRRHTHDIEVGLAGPATERANREQERTQSPRPAPHEYMRSAPVERGRERDGTGGAGPPPGRPSGSVLSFGRHLGWSIGEIARHDPGYLEWLEHRREGRPYLDEIDQTLVRAGYRSVPKHASGRTGKRPAGRRLGRRSTRP